MYLSPSDTYLGKKDNCIMESYYDCIIEDIIWKNFNHWNSIDFNCTKKCLPRYLIHNSTLQCEFDDDMKCALDVMYWKYVDHSNCPRPCSIVRYYGKVDFWQPWNSSDSSFSIDFKYAPPTKEKVYQEYLIYNFFDIFGSVGGTLGIFIGFSLNSAFNCIINRLKNVRLDWVKT